MSGLIAAGIDPGPATGIFLLHADGPPTAVQCDAVHAPWLLGALLSAESGARRTCLAAVPCGTEEFRRGSRQLKGAYPDITRRLVTELGEVARAWGLAVAVRPAATVKPWATDERLRRAGLLEVTGHGMVHARDAARHALFAAVHAGVLPDPLSRKAAQAEPGVPAWLLED